MAKKLTKKKSIHDSDLKKWKINKGISDNIFKERMEDKIKLWRQYYRGEQWPDGKSARYRDRIVVNMVFSNIKTIMPSINLRNPRYFVSAKKKPYRTKDGIFDTNESGAMLEMALNYYAQELNLKREVDKCLLDALLGPWGIMQYGYTLETEKTEKGKKGKKNVALFVDGPNMIRKEFSVDLVEIRKVAEKYGRKFVKRILDRW